MSLKLYLITCDLLQPADYASLRTRLRTLGARQILQNQWALRSTYTAAELKEVFRRLMDERDRVVVAEVGGEWSSRRAFASLGEV